MKRMVEICTCDNCKKEIEEGGRVYTIKHGIGTNLINRDVCQACYNDFLYVFFNSEGPKSEVKASGSKEVKKRAKVDIATRNEAIRLLNEGMRRCDVMEKLGLTDSLMTSIQAYMKRNPKWKNLKKLRQWLIREQDLL